MKRSDTLFPAELPAALRTGGKKATNPIKEQSGRTIPQSGLNLAWGIKSWISFPKKAKNIFLFESYVNIRKLLLYVLLFSAVILTLLSTEFFFWLFSFLFRQIDKTDAAIYFLCYFKKKFYLAYRARPEFVLHKLL